MITLPEPDVLIAVMLITDRCQLHCTYCELDQRAADMPRELAARVMEDLDCRVPPERPLYFAWHGGEPLMRGLDFFKWVRDFQSGMRTRRSVKNFLQTNGLLLDEAFLDFLAETGDFFPNISMDGPEPVTRATRGLDVGRYQTLFGRLKARGIPFGISVAGSPTLAKHRNDALAYFQEQGIRTIGVVPHHAMRPTPDLHPHLFADLLLDPVADSGTGREVPNAFGEALVQGLLGQQLQGPCGFSSFSGGCHRHVICVDVDGGLHTCLRGKWAGLWRYGSVAEGGLDDWWASTAGPAPFRPGLPKACEPCGWKSLCQGGCPSNAKAMNGGVDQPDYYCPSFQRIFEAMEDRLVEALMAQVEARRAEAGPGPG
ncbi:MAG TPA: radical SAM protein [Holophagaceae bacterium]|nr:radical SAM protein [Holophagaceae bacterium]